MIKDEVQRRLIKEIVDADFRGIVLSSVRSGKTRVLLTAIKEHCKKENPKVLILYPNVDVKNSWIKECELIGCPMQITYSTFISMGKYIDEEFDYYVFDEAHLIPEETKLPIAGQIAKKNKHVVFASGTYNRNTLADIIINTELPQIVDYTTEEAIQDGLVLNYTIYVHTYSLNPHVQRQFGSVKKWWSTDTREYDRLTKNVNNTYGEKKMLASLARMRFINSNSSLAEAINKWLAENEDERFLMFTENETFGKRFRLPMYNSKSSDDSVLKDFQLGKINQLCLIKKGSAGITYPNLKNILITSINSNGETLEQMVGRSLLTDTEHANIHVFVSDKEFQSKWLESALYNIKEERIVRTNGPQSSVKTE